MKTPEEILTSFLDGEGFILTDDCIDKIIYAMQEYAKEYALSLLPSDEEIKEAKIKDDECEYKALINSAYVLGQWDLKQQILNKLNT